jgi:aminoglycoside phosphotransferase (APT) family kinase protein
MKGRDQDLERWEPDTPAVRAWISESVGAGARVLRTRRLPKSSTAKLLIEVVRDDGSRLQLLLRRYDNGKRLTEDPWYVPAHEALALTLLANTPVPAPRLYAADLEGEVFDVPAILESWLPGEPVWNPADLRAYLAKTAEVLVQIHAVRPPTSAQLPSYAPYSEVTEIRTPSYRPGLDCGTASATHFGHQHPCMRPSSSTVIIIREISYGMGTR